MTDKTHTEKVNALIEQRIESRGAELVANKKKLEKYNQSTAELEQLKAELERLEADTAFFHNSLETAINWPLPNPNARRPKREGGKPERKINPNNRAGNPGNPGKWKGLLGYEFVCGVRDIQAAHNNCSIAEAIRILKKQDPKKWNEFKDDRALARRFDEAKKWWSKWYEWRVDLEARWEQLDARYKELIARSGV